MWSQKEGKSAGAGSLLSDCEHGFSSLSFGSSYAMMG